MLDYIDKYIDKLLTSSQDKPLWNIESIRLNRKPSWNYIDGVMLSSLIDLYKTTSDKKYLDFVINFVDYYINENGDILGFDINKHSTDDILESKVLFDLYQYTNKDKYIKAIKNTYAELLVHPRTKQGSFFHKAIYHDQVWLDGLYMVMPFYTKYSNMFLNCDYKDIILQFENVRKNMFSEEYKLHYHAYDESKTLFWADKKTGLSKNFWLRSIGWHIVSLIDTYELMKDSKEKERVKELFIEAINGIMQYIDSESNMFYQLPIYKDNPNNYLETSGSSMIAYCLLKGSRLGVLDDSYKVKGKEVFDGIVRKYLSINEDGDLNLKGIVLVGGVGPEDNLRRDGSIEYYLSEPVVENDAKGVAPFLMAYTEIIKI